MGVKATPQYIKQPTKKIMKKLLRILVLVLTTQAVGQAQEIDSKKIDHKIDSVLKANGILPFTRKLIIAQAKFESANFSSQLARNHCNIFGMQHPRVRRTTSLGSFGSSEGRKNRYASYSSVEDATLDYLYWITSGKEPRTKFGSAVSFVDHLHRRAYFGKPCTKAQYLAGINKYLHGNNKN